MNLRFVESFVSTAELGSFSRAAEALFVTQAAIAARVAKLEEELGVELFHRDGSTLRLTEQGRRAVPAAKSLMLQARDFLGQARDPVLAQGTLRVAWTGFVSRVLQPELLLSMRERYPRLNIEVQTLSSLDVMEALVEGVVDLAICVGSHASRLWMDMPLFSLPLRWMCSPALVDGRQVTRIADLAAWPIVTYPNGTLPYHAINQQLQDHGVAPPVLYSMSTVDETLTLACAGVGTTVLPPLVVRAELDAGRLVALDLPPPVPSIEFHAAFREQSGGGLCAEIASLARHLAKERIGEREQ